MTKGKVYIASMKFRGIWAEAPEGTVKLNVTSSQSRNSRNRRDFSPMTHIEDGYKGYWNFESFWQSGKVFEGVDEKVTKTFWKNLEIPKRRYPGSKDKKVLYARFEHRPDQKMDYLTSRKEVYVPLYFDLMKNTEMALHWKQYVENGKDVVVYDYDGPKLEDGTVTCKRVTKKLLNTKLHDTSTPFGHGYIVAGWLAGHTPEKYINI